MTEMTYPRKGKKFLFIVCYLECVLLFHVKNASDDNRKRTAIIKKKRRQVRMPVSFFYFI